MLSGVVRGTTSDIRRLDLGLMKSPYAGKSLQALGDASPSSLLISPLKKYRLSSGDI